MKKFMLMILSLVAVAFATPNDKNNVEANTAKIAKNIAQEQYLSPFNA